VPKRLEAWLRAERKLTERESDAAKRDPDPLLGRMIPGEGGGKRLGPGAARDDVVTSEPRRARCERCDNPINEREGIWVQDETGRLRITTVAHLEPHEQESASHFWHAGCLHTGPYR
jgi:hypothetical protein